MATSSETDGFAESDTETSASPGLASAEAFPPARTGWTAVVILLLLSIFSVLDRNLLTLLADPVKHDLGLADIELSLLLGLAIGLFYALGGVISGWAIDRFNRRLVICSGVVLWSCGTMLTAFSRTFGMLFAARASVGAGETVLPPGTYSLLTDLFPRDRLALPLSISALGLKLGQGFALVAGGMLAAWFPPSQSWEVPLIGTMKGWQIIYFVAGVPSLLLAFVIFLIPEPVRRGPRRDSAKTHAGFADYFRFMAENARFFSGHHFGQFMFVVTSVAVASWSPAYYARAHGWTQSETGYWLGSALMIFPLIGMPLHGYLADLLYRRGWRDIHLRYSMFSALIACPVGVAAFMVGDPHLSVLLVGLFMFVMSTYASLPLVAVQTVVPANMRGKSMSVIMLVIGTSALVLGPLFVALLTDLLFQDPAQVGNSIALCVAIGLPTVAICFLTTLAPLRGLMERT